MGDDQLNDKMLRESGLKITVPRLKIYQILENAKPRHLSAEEIYKQISEAGEDVGLATVYRVLTQFEAADLVIRHHFDAEHAVFEINEGMHHDHIVCIKCGKIEEFIDDLIEQQQQHIAKKLGFKITDHCLYLYGICERCQKL